MKIGVNDIVDCKIGTNQVAKVYLGSNLVWEKVVVSLLLDDYPNALVAYDLRKLSSSYTGSCIEVRRASDNAIQNIGFSNNILDTASLVTFAQGGQCFIRTLYDQSGNANNAVETTFTSQPQITDTSGVVITKYGKPSMYWNNPSSGGASSNLTFTQVQPHTLFITQQLEVVGGAYANWLLGGSFYDYLSASSSNPSTGTQYLSNVNPPNSVKQGNNYLNGQLREFVQNEPNFIKRDTNFNMISMVHDSSASRLPYASEISKRTQSTGVQGSSTIGWRQSIIIYGTDQSANQIAIEDNINKYYGIYPDSSKTGLLDDYPNASVAYSLRSLNSNYRGALVKIRRLADNEEKDIFAKYDGTLNTEDLLDFIGSDDGFVTRWYDQSGNSNDLTQVQGSLQPKLVSAGVVNLDGGKPAILYEALADQNLEFTTRITDNRSVFATVNPFPIDTRGYSQGLLGDDSTIDYIGGSGTQWVAQFSPDVYNGNNYINTTATNLRTTNRVLNVKVLISMIHLNSTGKAARLSKDRGVTTRTWSGNYQELIIYPSDETANLTGIQTNINTAYSIY